MATQHYQEQEQDDLMAAFDAPIKEVGSSTLRRRHGSKNVRSDFDHNNRKEVNKPTLKANFYKEADVPVASKKSSRLDDRARATVEPRQDVKERRQELSEEEVINKAGHTQASEKYRPSEVPEYFSSESFYVLLEEIQKTIIAKAGVLRNYGSVNAVLGKFVKTLDFVCEVPKYQEELKYITALALVCYGGSWTMLAGIIAAVEIFGTEEAIEQTLAVGNDILYEEYDNDHEVSPGEIKETFRNMALHFGLIVAVVMCPSVGEICISIAFACKFSPLVSAKQILKNMMMSPDVASMDLDDYFGLVDPEWFDLLSLFGCNIVSVILIGCFPRLITAMFMGYFGFCVFAETVQNGVNIFIPLANYSVTFKESVWIQKTTQCYVWAFVAVMAVWQATNGYSGSFAFLSWCMFLYPAVRIYNIFVKDSEYREEEKLY